jgi:predicted amidohydrolase
MAGNGREDCVGCVAIRVSLKAGRTYRLRARFRLSAGLNPHRNLLFCFYQDGDKLNDGIFRFRQVRGGLAEGEGRFRVPGEGEIGGQVRIYFRGSARGTVWIEELSLSECPPISPRPVSVVCVEGRGRLPEWSRVLDEAGRLRADLVLLPENMNGDRWETPAGVSARLMSEKAARHRMYVAGGILLYDRRADRLTNTVLLFGPRGRLAGRYDKVHPYSPEILDSGVAPGREAPVFRTRFGKVGVMTCYDSWFPDMAELLALKGAEIILLPNAGYYRSLMPARAADNGVRIAVSSVCQTAGIWDSAGRDVLRPDADPTCFANDEPGASFDRVFVRQAGPIKMLGATLDLSRTPSPHNWGGPMRSAPGGRRNRREQSGLLYAEIERQILRAWEEP